MKSITYYAKFAIEQDEHLDGAARYNRVFFPLSVAAKTRKGRRTGNTLIMLVERKMRAANDSLRERLFEDLYGRQVTQ